MGDITVEVALEKEKALIADGWTRQFTTFAPRVSEFVELYEALGYQVRVEPWALTPESDPACGDCVLVEIMRTIFTRKDPFPDHRSKG